MNAKGGVMMLKEEIPGHHTAIIVTMGLLLLMLVPSAPPAGSQDTVKIALGRLVSEDVLDRDGDGIYEYLLMNVELIVYVPGSYGLHGELGEDMRANAGPFDLGIGSHIIELRFPGGPISRSQMDGKVNLHVDAYSRDPEMETRSRDYMSVNEYSHTDFEPPSDGAGTEVSIVGDEIVLEGPLMEVRMNRTRPVLTFSYSGRASSISRASVSYLELAAFEDTNGNGILDADADTEKYHTDLEDVNWEIETDFSGGYNIVLYGILDLKLAGTGDTVGWARMTFSLSSEHMEVEPPSQKFDIDLDLWQPLDADFLGVRHVLKDETGKLSTEIASGEGGDGEYSITLKKEGKRPYGSYSWREDIMVGAGEADTPSRAASIVHPLEGGAEIWFVYPLQDDARLIHHDPTLSMDPNMPAVGGEERFLGNSPAVMLGGVALGILMVAATLVLREIRMRRRRKWESDSRKEVVRRI